MLSGSLLAACGDEEKAKSPVDEVTETMASAEKIQMELEGVINRLVVQCLEDEGFDVHPAWMTADPSETYGDSEEEEEESFLGEPTESYEIPTVEEAKENGLDETRNPEYDPEEDEDSGMAELDEDDPFYEMPEKYQKDYEIAQYGEEYYENMYEEPEEGEEGGEGPEEWPVEGGCTGEVNESVYGEPVEDEEEGGKYYGVEYPDFWGEEGDELTKRYETDAVIEAREKWATCVEERGHPYFEFVDGYLDLWSYTDLFYEEEDYSYEDYKEEMEGASDDEELMSEEEFDEMMSEEDSMGSDEGEGEEAPQYEAPEGAPWPDDEAWEKEKEFAVDIAECAEDVDLHKTAEKEWDKVTEEVAGEVSEEVFAYHDELEDALEKAQDLV
ncbi:MAG: hypothetical protein ACRDXX_14820 [Stackebrandtia sp.]